MAATATAVATHPITPEQASLWSDAWRRLRRNRIALLGVIYLSFLVLVALVAVVKMLWEERMGPLYKQLEHHYDAPGLWHAAIAEHRGVLKAIVAHDTGVARTMMQRHLNQAYRRFSKGWNALH